MFRVVRKEGPKIQSRIRVKTELKIFFHKPRQMPYLSRCYQATGLEQLFKLDRWLGVEL